MHSNKCLKATARRPTAQPPPLHTVKEDFRKYSISDRDRDCVHQQEPHGSGAERPRRLRPHVLGHLQEQGGAVAVSQAGAPRRSQCLFPARWQGNQRGGTLFTGTPAWLSLQQSQSALHQTRPCDIVYRMSSIHRSPTRSTLLHKNMAGSHCCVHGAVGSSSPVSIGRGAPPPRLLRLHPPGLRHVGPRVPATI